MSDTDFADTDFDLGYDPADDFAEAPLEVEPPAKSRDRAKPAAKKAAKPAAEKDASAPAAEADSPAKQEAKIETVSVERIVEVEIQAAELGAQYAVLGALKEAFETAQKSISGRMQELYSSINKNKGSLRTPFGSVAMKENPGKETVVISDPEELLAWVLANHAEFIETIQRIKPDAVANIIAMFAIAESDGEKFVVHVDSGETVEFMAVNTTPSRPPTPTWSASNDQKSTKMAAMNYVHERLGVFGDLISHEIASGGAQPASQHPAINGAAGTDPSAASPATPTPPSDDPGEF